MSTIPVIPPKVAWDLRRSNRREASEGALRLIQHVSDDRDPIYTMEDYEILADKIFNWLQEEKKP